MVPFFGAITGEMTKFIGVQCGKSSIHWQFTAMKEVFWAIIMYPIFHLPGWYDLHGYSLPFFFTITPCGDCCGLGHWISVESVFQLTENLKQWKLGHQSMERNWDCNQSMGRDYLKSTTYWNWDCLMTTFQLVESFRERADKASFSWGSSVVWHSAEDLPRSVAPGLFNLVLGAAKHIDTWSDTAWLKGWYINRWVNINQQR